MRRFILHIGIRVLILALIWIGVSRLIPKRWYLGPEYLRWETVFAALETESQSKLPKNLIIGDSGAEMGLDAKSLRACNFALGGSSFPEGYYILQQLAAHDLDTLYMSYGAFHFQSMDCFYTRSDFFGFIDDTFIDEVVALAEEKKDSAYLVKNWPWLDQLKQSFYLDCIADEFRFVHNMYDISQYRWFQNQGAALRDTMLANNYSYLVPPKGCPGDSTSMARILEKEQGRFQMTPVNAHYLGKILETCKKRGIQVIWVNMPLNDHTEQPSATYFEEFDHVLRYLMPENAPIVPFRTLDHCRFRDFSHLHAQAAKDYTQWMQSYLQDSLHSVGTPDSLTLTP